MSQRAGLGGGTVVGGGSPAGGHLPACQDSSTYSATLDRGLAHCHVHARVPINHVRYELRLSLSEVELKSLPLPAHDSAAGATATHRRTPWLDGDDGAADDLANTIAAHSADALGACKGCP